MSGGPVLVRNDGAVVALVKATRAEGTALGGLLTPMRGLWELTEGARVWREHDLFHSGSREWTMAREELGPRSEFAGILKPSDEVDLLAILARLPGEARSATSGPPLRSVVQDLSRQRLSGSSVHPLLKQTWQLSRQAADSELAGQLERWTLVAAGSLGLGRQFSDWLQEQNRVATPLRPPVRRAERRALLLGGWPFTTAGENPVDKLAAALADADAGHFGGVDKPDLYADPELAGRVAEFTGSSAPSDVLLLYLAGGLAEQAGGHDLILDLSARPARANRAGALAAPDQRLSLQMVAEAAARINDQASLIVLLDYFCLPDAPADVPAAVQRCWSVAEPNSTGLIVVGLERPPYGRFADLASLACAAICGEERETGTGEDVTVRDLVEMVGQLRPHGWSLVPDPRFDQGLTLAHGPLSEADSYVRNVLAAARRSGLPQDIRIRYRLSDTTDPGTIAREMRATRNLWESLASGREHRTIAWRLLKEHDEIYRPVLEAAEAGQAAVLRSLLLRFSRPAPDKDTPADQGGSLGERIQALASLWGIITPEDRDLLIQGHGRDEVAAALRRGNVRVAEPPELPVIPVVPGLPAFGAWLRSQGGRRHLFDLVPGDEPRAGVPAGLLGTPADSSPGLTSEVISGALAGDLPAEVQTAAEPLRTLDAAGLRRVALYQMAAQLRALPEDRKADDLLRSARELGLADKDARLLGFAVAREPNQNPALLKIASLIDENRVCAALDALTRLGTGSGSADRDLALLVLRERRAKALDVVSRARGELDADSAWAILDEAEAIAADLEAIAEVRREHPPRPSGTVEAQVDTETDVVRVSWERSASTVGEIRYQVHCHEGVRPVGGRDTYRLIEDETVALTVEDRAAPSNVPLWYSVVAVRGGARSPRATTQTPSFRRPRVSTVLVQPGDGKVALRWRTPEGASFVEVHRIGGPSAPRPVPARPGDALDEGLSNGQRYQYQLVAVYVYDGRQVRSQP
ncbi:MAG: hypothetical protein ACRDOC_13570, partial [Streptosporangiaceae bacterium]